MSVRRALFFSVADKPATDPKGHGRTGHRYRSHWISPNLILSRFVETGTCPLWTGGDCPLWIVARPPATYNRYKSAATSQFARSLSTALSRGIVLLGQMSQLGHLKSTEATLWSNLCEIWQPPCLPAVISAHSVQKCANII